MCGMSVCGGDANGMDTGTIMEMTGLDKGEMEGIKCDGFVMVIFGGLGILL